MRHGAWMLAAVLACADAGAADTTWRDLWQTPDQQGQSLLTEGKPAEAAARFKDEQHKAYAELRAGEYASAAKHLEQYKDPDSQYNRGNALARSGDLKGALSAYDQALATRPEDKDAKRNRDLVADTLRRQQQQQANGKSGDGQGKQGDKGDQRGQAGQGGQSGQNQQGGQQGSQGQNAQNQPPGQSSGSQGTPQSQAGNEGQGQQQANPPNPQGADHRSAQNEGSDHPDQQNAQGQSAGSQSPQAKQGPQGGGVANPNGKEQDANAGKQNELQARESAKADVSNSKSGNTGPRPPGDTSQFTRQAAGQQQGQVQPSPPTENTLALDQWLRRIPDDPGELLRRKFLVEHMQKQEGPQ